MCPTTPCALKCHLIGDRVKHQFFPKQLLAYHQEHHLAHEQYTEICDSFMKHNSHIVLACPMALCTTAFAAMAGRVSKRFTCCSQKHINKTMQALLFAFKFSSSHSLSRNAFRSGYGMVTEELLDRGSVLVQVPRRLLMTLLTAQASPEYGELIVSSGLNEWQVGLPPGLISGVYFCICGVFGPFIFRTKFIFRIYVQI